MFRNKNKNGFTLVELLTVLVIIGIIATIITPLVLGVITSIKKSAAESSAYAYIKAINYQNNAHESFDKENKLKDDVYDVLTLDVKSKGNKPVYGEVNIIKGDVKTADMCIGGYYVSYSSGNVTVGDECITNIDDTEPELVFGTPIVTTNLISLPFEAKDNDSGISLVTCTYGITKGNEYSGKINGNSCEIRKLKANTTYKVEVKAINKGNLSTAKNIELTTKNITSPVWTGNSAGYTASKKLTVTFDKGNVEEPMYFVRSSVPARASVSLKTCTSIAAPRKSSDCTGDILSAGSDIYEDTWYMLQNSSKADITITENGSLYAIVGDGVQTSEASTIVITTIDNTPPILKLGTPSTTINSISIPFSENSDKESDIVETICEYGINTSYGSIGTVNNNKTNCTINDLSVNTNYKYMITTKNGAGLTKTVTGNINTSSFGTITIKSSPTDWSKSKTITITGSTVGAQLQYKKGSSGSWTTINSGGTFSVDSNITIYARFTDGKNISSETTYSILTIDNVNPTITLNNNNISKSTSRFSIPFDVLDAETGVKTISCTYGTTSDTTYTGTLTNITSNTNDLGNISNGSYTCSATGLSVGTTYKYKLIVTDAVGNSVTKTGTIATGTTGVSFTSSQYPTNTTYAQYKNVKVDFTHSNLSSTPTYYVKTTSASTSDVTGYACGNSTSPGTCSSSGTTSFSAGYWYKVSSSPTLKIESSTFTTDANSNTIDSGISVYGRINDGYTYSSASSITMYKIDTTYNSSAIGTITTSTSTIRIPYTFKDYESGITNSYCKYGTSANNFNYNGTVTRTSSTTDDSGKIVSASYVCTFSGLSPGTTYYTARYGTNGAGKTVYYSKSITTGSVDVNFTETERYPADSDYSFYRVVKLDYESTNLSTSAYYIKTTMGASVQSEAVYACGTGSTPGTCDSASVDGIEPNTWYKIEPGLSSTEILFLDNGTIYGVIYDGNSYITAKTYTASKMDKTSPSISLGTPTTTTSTISIPITVSEGESGISNVKCQYGTSSYTTYTGSVTRNSYSTNDSGDITSATYTCTLSGLSSYTRYKYKVTVENLSGLSDYENGDVLTKGGSIYYTFSAPSTSRDYYTYKDVNLSFSAEGNNPAYYVKSTVALTYDGGGYVCGAGTTPSTCSTTSTTLFATNTWYKVNGSLSLKFRASGTLYALIMDGTETYDSETISVTYVDSTNPELTIGTPTKTTTTLLLPININRDHQSGIIDTTCLYGTSSGTYSNLGTVNAAATTCTLSGLTAGTTYYYKITNTNGAGLTTEVTGSAAAATASVSITTQWTTSYTHDPYVHSTVNYSTTATNPKYFVKTTVATTSDTSGYECGNSTNPGTCSSTTTTSFKAGYWYQVSSNPKVKFSSNGTIYGLIYDGNQYLTAATRSYTNIDPTSPNLSLGTPTTTTSTIVIPFTTNSDSESKIRETTCTYGTTSSANSYSGTVNSDKTSCSITGLNAATTYYYKVTTMNNAGLTTTKTGSAKTSKLAGSITTAPSPKTLTYNGSAQTLITAGSGTGTMYYKLSTASTYSTSLPTATNAGTYTIQYYAASSTSYNSTSVYTVSVTISKAAGSYTTRPTGKTVAYTGSSLTLVNGGSTSTGTIYYKIGSSGTYSTSLPTASALGTYTIYYKITGNSNYNDVAESTLTSYIKTNFAINAKVGDYVSMTPSLSSFTTSTSYTGYSSTQTIYPSELKLWRIIKINSSGTVEMISEYVSSTAVYFKGKTGFKNFVGYLNVLASKYVNTTYTTGSRHMGYYNQTQYLTNTSNSIDSATGTPPWTADTGNGTVESQGGGDTGFSQDMNTVINAVGSLYAKQVNTSTNADYWLASRFYGYYNKTEYGYYADYNGRKITATCNLTLGCHTSTVFYSYGESVNYIGERAHRLRPIVTLKSGLNPSGSGTSSSPWKLN